MQLLLLCGYSNIFSKNKVAASTKLVTALKYKVFACEYCFKCFMSLLLKWVCKLY